MINRRFLIAGLLSFSLTGSAASQSVKLPADEIMSLLSGKTASGKWEGKLYRQYFNTDGTTIFAQDGSRSAQGNWRINKKTDEYESIWPGEKNWTGWFVMEYAGAYYWVSKTTPPTPFRLLQGQQLVRD